MIRTVVHNWERKLARRDTRRTIHEFDWGLEFLQDAVAQSRVSAEGLLSSRHDAGSTNGEGAKQYALAFNERAIAESTRFFEARPVSDYSLDGEWLSFPSPVQTPYPENNTAYARYLPISAKGGDTNGRAANEVERAGGRAVLVLPQWNADVEGHVALCKLLNRFGIAALRLSLPYHDRRLPAGSQRADYLVSPNVGRTLSGCLQAVLDSRAAIDWLVDRGYSRIGILGTSIGSCIAFLTVVHDRRLAVAVFNHVSSYFGDVVWAGLTTAHVRQVLETALSREEVRKVWAAISPNSYVPLLASDSRRGLMISARYDLSFLPELSEMLFDECHRYDVNFEKFIMPCGHYSLGEAPFKYLAAYVITNYFRKNL
jgi:hypothetical protein